jgi:hypothetical protein
VSVWGIRHLVGILLSFQFVFSVLPSCIVSEQTCIVSFSSLSFFFFWLNTISNIEEPVAVVHHHSPLF